MAVSYGWTGKILWVDLSRNKITKVATSDYEPEKYLGGVGLNSKIFWKLGSPKVDAFSPDNPLLISVGPLTGLNGSVNRGEVGGIAPQSYPNESFTYSGFGGKFPSALKYAGYDGIVILGKSSKPVYLLIEDDKVSIQDAKDVWGLDTFETQQRLRSAYPQASVFTIGPAGENLSRIAIILNETSSASGQGGFGAVMGSKKLKAIVVRGSGSVKIAKPDVLEKFINDRKADGDWKINYNQLWARTPSVGGAIATEMKNYYKKPGGCFGCPFQCQGFYDVPNIGKGVQMCTDDWYGYFTSGNAPAHWEGNILSQKLGINNADLLCLIGFISTGIRLNQFTRAMIGVSSVPQIDKPKPGQSELDAHHQFLTELLGGIANGTSIFSQGVARAAKQLGNNAWSTYEKYSTGSGYRVHHIESINAALLWAMDSRDPFNSSHDTYFTFGTSPGIATHFGIPVSSYIANGVGIKNIYDQTEIETSWVQIHQSLKNSLTICEYASLPSQFYHPPSMDVQIFESQLLSAVTGIDYSVPTLWQTGERILNLRRTIMILREDRTRVDDTLNHLWFEQKVGGAEGLVAAIDKTKFEALKDRYYQLRGWNVTNGWPTREKLQELGLKDVADKLAGAKKLG